MEADDKFDKHVATVWERPRCKAVSTTAVFRSLMGNLSKGLQAVIATKGEGQ